METDEPERLVPSHVVPAGSAKLRRSGIFGGSSGLGTSRSGHQFHPAPTELGCLQGGPVAINMTLLRSFPSKELQSCVILTVFPLLESLK